MHPDQPESTNLTDAENRAITHALFEISDANGSLKQVARDLRRVKAAPYVIEALEAAISALSRTGLLFMQQTYFHVPPESETHGQLAFLQTTTRR